MSNEVVLYLMRHGETIINRAKRVQGWCDGVLTEKGLEVAENVALGLSDIRFEAVYSSDLGRARKTAKIAISNNKVSNNLELNEVEGLREAYFGKYEGELEEILFNDILTHLNVGSFEEAIEKYDFQKEYINACATLDDTNSAENYETLINRIMNSLINICEKHEGLGGGNLLLVIHGGILRVIIEYIDNSFDIRNIENASISKITYENGKFSVESVNDMSYRKKGELIKEQLV